jgi:hypothetical protein
MTSMEYFLIFPALGAIALLVFVWSSMAGRRVLRDHEQKIIGALTRRGAHHIEVHQAGGATRAVATYQVSYVDYRGFKVKVKCIVNDGRLFWTDPEALREQLVLKSGR